MSDEYKPIDIKSEVDVNSGTPGDSIQFVSVPGEDKVFLYLWDTETQQPTVSVVGFTADGIEMLQDWLTNVDIEARSANHTDYGDDDE
jgi:hypothetical protein